MAADSETYIAWDGNRYPGQPPEDWYLAIDNRWWPSSELLDEAYRLEAEFDSYLAVETEVDTDFRGDLRLDQDADPMAGTYDQSPPTVVESLPPPLPAERQSNPSPSWAPESARTIEPESSNRSQPAPPTQTGGSGQPVRTRRRRRGLSGSRFFWPILIFAMFRFISQCDLDVSEINSSPPTPPQSDVEQTSDQTEALPELQADGSLLFSGRTTTLLITNCGQNGLSGEVQNTGLDTTSVAYQIEAMRIGADRITPLAAAYSADELGPFERRPFNVEVSPLVGEDETCEVQSATETASP